MHLFMRVLRNFLVLMSFNVFFVQPLMAVDENWVKYFEYTDGSALYYDKDSVRERTRHIKQVWFKRQMSTASRENLLQRLRDQGFSAEGYDKLSHHVVLFIVDCREMKSKPLSTMDYDSDGNVLFRNRSIDQPHWDDIQPNNPMMVGLYEIVCKPSP